uniref:Iroquois homeobox 1a n=1 Tax=Myripristis murdjan TaxID=586833 RepID=A0A668AVD4_9TELE
MSFPQLGYPQYLSASQAVYGSERPGVLTPSSRGGSTEIGGSPSATAAAVTSVLGMYANPYAHNYSAFLPYTSADLALFSQMGSQYDLKDSPGVHPASFAAHTSPAFYPYGQFQYGDPARHVSSLTLIFFLCVCVCVCVLGNTLLSQNNHSLLFKKKGGKKD